MSTAQVQRMLGKSNQHFLLHQEDSENGKLPQTKEEIQVLGIINVIYIYLACIFISQKDFVKCYFLQFVKKILFWQLYYQNRNNGCMNVYTYIIFKHTPNIPSHCKILNITSIRDLPIILLLRITSLKTNNLARKVTSLPHHTKLVKLRWPSLPIHTQHLFHYTDNCWLLDFLLGGRDI